MNSQYITDNTGNRMAVILPIEEYSQILNELEELDAIRAYDAAKASKDEVILILPSNAYHL